MVAERAGPWRWPDLGLVCRNGHRRTYKNLYRHGNGHRRCLACLRDTRRRYELAHPERIAYKPRPSRARPRAAFCKNGHPLTPETTRWCGSQRRCTACLRETSREYKRRKRAQARLARQMTTATSLASAARPEPSQAPLTGFDAVVAAQVAQVREIAAKGRPTFRDVLKAGERAERERQWAARGPIRGKPTPEQIRAATADAFGLDVADLTGPCREYDVSHPRQAAYYLIRQLCPDVTFDAIGALFGGRDHSTVCYGYEKIARLVAAGDKATLRMLDEIKGALA